MKTFILGVGAQKAGSTWLFKYLNKLPGAIRPFYKEFHIWNALEIPECQRWKYAFNPDLLKTIQPYHPEIVVVGSFITRAKRMRASAVTIKEMIGGIKEQW